MVAGGNARYDGLVSTIQHRASNGFTILANHTWSHCFDLLDNPGAFNTVSMQNPNNHRGLPSNRRIIWLLLRALSGGIRRIAYFSTTTPMFAADAEATPSRMPTES